MSLSTMFKSCGNSENLRTFTDRVLADLTAIRTAATASIVDRAASLVPIAALIVDRAANKTQIDALVVDRAASIVPIAAAVTWATEVDADLDDINDNLAFFGQSNDGILYWTDAFAISAAAAATALGAGIVHYQINGVKYVAALDTTIALTDTTVVTTGLFKAWRVEMGILGDTVTTTVTGSAGFDSAQAAYLALGSVARTADYVTVGYFVIESNGGFTPGTDNTNGESSFASMLVTCKRSDYGLTAEMSASIAIGATPDNFSHGTVNGKRAVNLAEIAVGADVEFTDADTIIDGETGGWLLCIDQAGTAVVTISSDGLPGVTALADTDVAGCNTALDLVADRLPEFFIPFGKIVVTTVGAGFTAKTTSLVAGEVTTVYTDQTATAFDRTVGLATFLARMVAPPAIPATVTAPLFTAATAPTATAAAAATAVAATAPTASAPAAITTVALTYE